MGWSGDRLPPRSGEARSRLGVGDPGAKALRRRSHTRRGSWQARWPPGNLSDARRHRLGRALPRCLAGAGVGLRLRVGAWVDHDWQLLSSSSQRPELCDGRGRIRAPSSRGSQGSGFTARSAAARGYKRAGLDGGARTATDAIPRLGGPGRVPVLVVHGTEDRYVPIDFMHAAPVGTPRGTWQCWQVQGTTSTLTSQTTGLT